MTGPATRCKLLAIRRYTPLSETTSSIQTIRIPGWWGQGQGDRRIQPEIWTYTFQLYMDCKKRWIQDPIFNHPVLISPIYVFARHYCQDSKPIDRQLAFCTPTTENISVYIHPSWYRIYIYIFSNPLPPTPLPPFTAMVINLEAMNLPAHESLVAGGSFGKATMRQILTWKMGKKFKLWLWLLFREMIL